MSVPTPAAGIAAPPPPRNVAALLMRLQAEKFTGAVEVSGTPGGIVHLQAGLVIAVETPNAPSVETLLIRSRRIDQESWAAAIKHRAAVAAEGGDAGDLSAVLTELRLVGRGELEAVRLAAVYDAAFAMALNPAEGWTVHDAAVPPELATWPGESPRRLAEETSRRIAALSLSWGSVADLAAARCRPATRIDSALLTARQQAVLLAADGRRTPRDIAFFLGCGIFPTMLDLAHLRARRLIQSEAPRSATPPSTARRVASTDDRTDERTGLPRRPVRARRSDDTSASRTTEGTGSS